jgi:hypothetical protein
MKTRILAFALSLVIVFTMSLPAYAVKGPLTNSVQDTFYGSGQASEFAALMNNTIDLMSDPLTYSQYVSVAGNPSIQVAPYFALDDREIAFNNNATDPHHTADRKAMNYTEFRQAMACLVDKDGLIAGANVNGFGTRIDTPVPRPIQDAWVNFNMSMYASDGTLLNNYPWNFNETKALEILWNNGWYSHSTYPSVAALVAALPLPAGSVHYPPGHPRAGMSIDSIVANVRSDDPVRKQAGENLVAEMQRIGISVTLNEGGSIVTTPVFINHDYDFYTAGWSFGQYPLQFYSSYTPVGIYAGGPNLYMIDDANLTYHATMEYPNATSSSQSVDEAKICQEIIVKQAMFVPLYTTASYIAYRTGCTGIVNFRGYGLSAHLDFTYLGGRTSSGTIRIGFKSGPYELNPIFSYWSWEHTMLEAMFTSYMNVNPYKPTIPGKSPTGGDLPWMAYDWKYETMPNGNANVTYWFRHDITWQDGVPFTVDDFNYTIFIQAIYGDSWGYSDMIHCVNPETFAPNFQKWDSWTCSVQFDSPSFWGLYTTLYDIVPMHIYKYIAIPADAPSGMSTTGHHGEWPGKDSLASEILPGAPFTYAQLTGAGGEQYVWVGTNMWKYHPGTYVAGEGGGLVCDAYTGFWMSILQGDIDFSYFWNPGPPPQSGSYKVGLSDLVLLANAYGTNGTAPKPFKLGGKGVWEPGCDIAAPSCFVGLSDLVTLALNYGKTWGSNP